ncbi:MAG: TonB-dependent receptor [Flavobacteriales bacterium]|jgi:outer membrane receptor for ferrienterochelin and colicins|uniref:TonB-dependent receptor n=1 Tax=Candidatus Ulvibacter alkanivorans TaxID=2267620 RepID=UPI000DF38BBD|nr:carboxypeptidase-like regulatory domain-containing protein [Candidatus Ulvibacter alkanivorans]MCH2489323.1 TonB-dependent receptor [Flavobacteriales bacterium]
MRKLIYILFFISLASTAQEKVEGIVLEIRDNKEYPLDGANVFWLGSNVGDVTDFDGMFELPFQQGRNQLVISYVGYKTDTLTVANPKKIRHVLRSKADLDEITITSRQKATARSFIAAENKINISSAELLKAACCNLSESFETNPSIDVNFADAVTGVRQIRMLGLTNPYILITTENIPAIRGARQAHGLSFIPGTWVESIQITKGAGSVINGFESIAGQINAEFVKPQTDDPLFVNAYGALNGRTELNTHLNTKISEKWDTGLYVHGNYRGVKNDQNEDGLLDTPLAQQLNVMNRWQYTDSEKGFVGFLGLRFMTDDKQIGQTDFDPEEDRGTMNAWGGEIDTKHYGLEAKLGYVFPNIPYQSLGLQLAYSNHDQKSYFGLRPYDVKHESFYANAQIKSIISDSRHVFRTGLTATYEDYDEIVESTDYSRVENSIGAFFEYAYDDLEDFTMTAGIRADVHNLLGTFVTPRLHARYTPWEKAAFRVSAGRGKRSANIFVENQSLFSTNREIIILDTEGEIYGLDPEIAWNYGVSFLQGFDLFERRANVSFDFYRTDFQNQVIVDWEDTNSIRFYNLDGSSYANSFQVELDYSLTRDLDIRTAYKFYDVKTDYLAGRLEKPLTPSHRVFANIAYETPLNEDKGSQWKFDLTYNWLGEQRYPSTDSNPIGFRRAEFSPALGTFNAQVTKVFSPSFEIYLGGENFTNETQNNPIIDPENPFGSNFDTTFVYGPIFGSNYYIGLRYRL